MLIDERPLDGDFGGGVRIYSRETVHLHLKAVDIVIRVSNNPEWVNNAEECSACSGGRQSPVQSD